MYKVMVNSVGTITNIKDLPDDSPVGHIFSFHLESGKVIDSLCVQDNGPLACLNCVFQSRPDRIGCPWDPDIGDYLCGVYECGFHHIEKVLENL